MRHTIEIRFVEVSPDLVRAQVWRVEKNFRGEPCGSLVFETQPSSRVSEVIERCGNWIEENGWKLVL